ncbi:phosphatase PAP2 family protein [Zavarzinia sp. CC-PAN008]|uniref:vanadium-dependent haloperoxidase n=1 Tax=Zavarzinia sp. CC-PAN008 TaxID=3243332 RepID=UPI003F747502
MLILPPVEDPVCLNGFPVLYWNHVGLQMNRITHSVGGPQGGPTMSSRALGLLHLAMHDAWFLTLEHADKSDIPPYLQECDWPKKPVGLGKDLEDAQAALTGAAIFVLDALYAHPGPAVSISATDTLTTALSAMIADYGPHIDTLGLAHNFGVEVARIIVGRLAVKPGEPGADQGRFEPTPGVFNFGDEPVNPVRRAPIDPNDPTRGDRAVRTYHGPFYGTTVADFAVTDPDGHAIRDWRSLGDAEYLAALREVKALGGAAGQVGITRTPDESVAAYYWAYDGANLIGTPPRLYNQILRVVANDRKKTCDVCDLAQNSEFVRLFALANVAMADAGKFAWREKYRYMLWRPLSGVREHVGGPDGVSANPALAGAQPHVDPDADPFWRALGAPETNSNRLSFKPPFPAYPSGHATFGAACFQMVRHFYNKRDDLKLDDGAADDIGFTFVSEELNGHSRDLHQPHVSDQPIEDQPGVVRARVVRHFGSLWRAIFENAFSRIWLGVHWRFDAFDVKDALDESGNYKAAEDISYSHVWKTTRKRGETLPVGGVPLGLGIANDIWSSGMRAPAAKKDSSPPQTDFACKISNTTYQP